MHSSSCQRLSQPLPTSDKFDPGLRETRADFSQFLFDIDFPGHYCRRIDSVSLAIPCIVGPYASLNCTLRLRQHKYRISTEAESAASYPETPSDLRFRTDNIPITSIAIGAPIPSTGQTGTFSFGFPGNSYSPFQGAGVISTWQIDLPPELRQFEYRTISDVVLQLRYTALDGGPMFRRAASDAVLIAIKQPSEPAVLAMLVNVSSDYASEWYSFRSQLKKGESAYLNMPGVSGMLPFWTQRLKVTVDSISVILFPALSSELDTKEMTIAEYPGITLERQDLDVAGDCGILVAKNIGKEMATDWKVTLPNSKGSKEAIDTMWFLINYSAER